MSAFPKETRNDNDQIIRYETDTKLITYNYRTNGDLWCMNLFKKKNPPSLEDAK